MFIGIKGQIFCLIVHCGPAKHPYLWHREFCGSEESSDQKITEEHVLFVSILREILTNFITPYSSERQIFEFLDGEFTRFMQHRGRWGWTEGRGFHFLHHRMRRRCVSVVWTSRVSAQLLGRRSR